MEFALIIYGIGVADAINHLTTGLIVVSALCSVVSFFCICVNMDTPLATGDYLKLSKRCFKASLIVLIVSLFFTTIVPDRKTAYIALGAYLTQKTVESEIVGRFAGKLLTIVEEELDKIIDERVNKGKKNVQK